MLKGFKKRLKTASMESAWGAVGNSSTSQSLEHSETPSGSDSQDEVLDLSISIKKVDDIKAENLPSTSQGFFGVQYANRHQPVFSEQFQIKPECLPVPDASYPYLSHCSPTTQIVYSGANFIQSPVVVPSTRASVIIPSTVTAERAVVPMPPTPENTSQTVARPYIANSFYPPAPMPHIPTVPSHSPEGPRGSTVGTSTSPAMPPPPLPNVLTKITSHTMMLNQLLAQNSLSDIHIREGKGGRPFKEVAVDSGLPQEEEKLYEEFRKRVKMHVTDEHKGQKSQKGVKRSLSPEPSTSQDCPDAKQPCPDGKTEAYWEKRRKNNEAAKRSRDARRAKEDELAIRVEFLLMRIRQLYATLCTCHLSAEQWMEDVRREVHRQCPGVNIQLPRNPIPPNIYGVPGHMPF